MKKKISANAIYNLIFPVAVICIILIVWLIAERTVNEEIIVPSIKTTFKEMLGLFGKKNFYESFGYTLLRVFASFFISFVLALGLAVLSYRFTVADGLIRPLVAVVRAVPTVAVILWFVLWLDSSLSAMLVAVLVIFPSLYGGIASALGEIDKDVIEMLTVYKVKKSKIFFKFILPVILPSLLLSAGNALSLNLKLMASAEVLSSTAKSLGEMLNASKIYYNSARLMALTVITVVVAIIMEIICRVLSKAVSRRWKK